MKALLKLVRFNTISACLHRKVSQFISDNGVCVTSRFLNKFSNSEKMDNGENYQNKVCLKPDLLGSQKCTRKPYFCSWEDHLWYWAFFYKSDLTLIWTREQSKKIFALPIANFRRNEQILIKKKKSLFNLFSWDFNAFSKKIEEK